MKIFRWLAAGGLVLLLAALVLFRTSHPRPAQLPSLSAVSGELKNSAITPANPVSPSAVAKTPAATKEENKIETKPAASPFENWAREFAAADETQRAALLAKSEEMAKTRHAEMARLIRTNPEQAIKEALPYELRKQLPASVLSLIEQPVHGRGDLSVFGAFPSTNPPADFEPMRRELALNGRQYKPYFYGSRLHLTTRSGIPVSGVALNEGPDSPPIIAVGEPLQLISKAEADDLQAKGIAKADPICPGSGLRSSTFGQPVSALLGNQVIQFCHLSHEIQFNEHFKIIEGKLVGDSGDPGGYPTNVPPGTAVNSTQGRKTVLFIRLRFPDDPTEPISESGAYALMNGVNQFYVNSSYNTLSMDPTVTPVLTLPQPKRWYGDRGGPGQLLADGREAARAAGYYFLDYDLDCVAFVQVPGTSFNFGGLAYVGARGVWLQSISTGVACHEFGHNLGLFHANFWQTGSASGPPNPLFPNPNYPIDATSLILRDDINAAGDTSTTPGKGDVEYGDPFDTMGSAAAGIYQFSAHAKYHLKWLADRYVKVVTESQTNRLYSFDAPSQSTGHIYALRVTKDFQREYWIDHRSLWTSNPWQSSGVELHWNDWAGTDGTSQLLDTTPGSTRGKEDCAIVVGRTFADPQTSMFITPIAKGGSGVDEYIDVVVNFGVDPANLPPTVAISADDSTVAVGANVTFSADATDPNGDPVVYHWEFGDDAFGNNSAVVSHTFTTAGKYVVRCEASDMKGGIGSAQMVVTVGSTNRYVMAGQLLDNNGNPLQGVRVHNSAQGANYRVGYSDSDGNYLIGNVPPGNYTNFAFNYGAKSLPLFANPVQVSAQDVGGLDHILTDFPHVSIGPVADADEGAPANGQFLITRTGDTSGDLKVFFVASGTAVSGTQYVPFAGNSVIIPAGSSSATLDVIPQADGTFQGPTTVTVTLRLATNEVRVVNVVTNVNGTNIVVQRTNTVTFPGWELDPIQGQLTWFQTYPQYVLGNAEATVFINDADSPSELPTVSIFALDDTAVETGNDSATLVVTRTGSIEDDLTVNYYIGPGLNNPATSDDYVPVTGQIVIPAGQLFATFSVIARDDLFVEGNETLFVYLSDSDEYTVGTGAAQVLIVDDDLPLVTVNATDATAIEPGNTGTFTFTRAGDVSGNLVVNYLVTGTATSGVDFQTLPGQVTIPAGQVSATVTVTPIDDASLEGDETVSIFISESPTYNIGNPSGATVTLQDNELPTVTLAVTTATASEPGTPGVFTLTRNGPTNASLKVNFFVGGTAIEQADYGSIGTNVTFVAGSSNATIVINPVDETFRELAETVIVVLQPGTNYNVGNPNTGTVTINDNDGSELPAVGFMLKSLSVPESIGLLHIPVMISAAPTVQKGPAIVEWHITGGSGVQNTDYILASTGYLSFNSNVPLVTNLDVLLIDNDFVQAPRTLLITLFDPQLILTNNIGTEAKPTNVISVVPTNSYLGSYRTFTLTILDDDTNIVTVDATQPLAREQGMLPGYFTLTRQGPTNRAVTVNYSITGSASSRTDFSALGTQVTIPAGTNSVRITVAPVDDGTEEYVETVQLRLISVVGGQIGFPQVATINIQDNDGTVQFTLPNYDITESVGVASIPVQRSGDTNLLVTVDYRVFPGTAIAGVDFTATNGTLVFLPGELRKNVNVTIVDDNLVEPDETISLALTNPTGGVQLGGQKSTTITIINDDTAFDFATATFRVNENDGVAEIVIHRSGILTNADSVVVTATNGTAGPADFVATNVLVKFLPDETNHSVFITILDDDLFETNETVNLTLSNPSPGRQLGLQSNATLVIVDDECKLDFQVTGYSVIEYSNFVTLVVRRTGGTVNPVSVTYSTSDGTATNGLDYLSATNVVYFSGDHYEADTNGSGNLVFVAGDSFRTIQIPILDDALGEGDETFFVTLSDPQGPNPGSFPTSTLLGPNTVATVTIIDDETPGNVDYQFDPGDGANGIVRSVALAPRGGLVDFQGRVVIGGDFTLVDGVSLNHIARLLPNGTLDTAFNPGSGANNNVFAVAAQPDGRVLAGGDFTTMNNTNRLRLARLNADGKLDTGFDLGPSGVNGTVRAIALQADGQVIIGGDFTVVSGFPREHVARLGTNGVLDTNFVASINGNVNALAIQADGKVVIGGAFTTVGGSNRVSLARLNANGTLDPTLTIGAGFDGPINAVALQSDGKILAGGAFANFNGSGINNLVRLSTLGVLDFTFKSGTGPDAPVHSIAFANAGKIVIGGAFTNYNAVPRPHFARLTPGGSVDNVFQIGSGANGLVRSVIAQEDSAIVIGGDFTIVSGLPRNHIARIHGDDKLDLLGVQFSSSLYSVSEDGGQTTIMVVRTGNTNRAFTVDFTTSDGSANAPADYAATNGTLSFAAGELSKTFDVRVFNDSLAEGDETVSLILHNASANVDLSSLSSATLVIIDTAKSVSFSASSYTVGEADTNAIITLVRSGSLVGNVTITLSTSNGTAAAGYDYIGFTNTLTFTNGESIKNVPLPLINNDSLPEFTENLFLRLTDGTALAGTLPLAVLNIIDDDPGPGNADSNFNPGSGATRFVRALALQADGRLLVGGAFTNFATSNLNFIARLQTNGTVDATFNPGTGPNALVSGIGVSADGHIAIGGAFSNYNGSAFNHLVRLTTNGAVDPAFAGSLSFDSAINATTVQADGRMIVGGGFKSPANGVVRVRVNSSLDLQFDPGSGADAVVNAVALQPDGKVLIGGAFTNVAGFTFPRLARLGSDGTLDSTFVPITITQGVIFAVAVGADGKIIIGGNFQFINGLPRHGIARLNDNGTLDSSFNPGTGANGNVYTVCTLTNGTVFLGGDFLTVNGSNCLRYALLQPNGSVNPFFDASIGADNTVYASLVTPNQQIVIGGDFTTVGSQPRRGVARLNVSSPETIRFLRASVIANSAILRINSIPGSAYILEGSGDFSYWFTLSTNLATGATLDFTDPNVSSNNRRFYRARRYGP